MKKSIPAFLAVLGIADSLYLTYEHYSGFIPPCTTGFIADCGKVLTSEYAEVFGIPLALIGVLFYSTVFILSLLDLTKQNYIYRFSLFGITAGGIIASAYFVYLQLWVIGALCLYCIFSAVTSLLLFLSVRIVYPKDYYFWRIFIIKMAYKHILKKILFLIDPEIVHNGMTRLGEIAGFIPFIRTFYSWWFVRKSPALKQKIHGIQFDFPVGLSAGFDYEARLTQILSTLGFGFQSVGTITCHPYEGNTKPRLGRLPKSKSLLVNKGLKNEGAVAVATKLKTKQFAIPVGISIGRTNTAKIKTLQDAIRDIVCAFSVFEHSMDMHAYYELNISCPNIKSTVSFYPPPHLEKLLQAVTDLNLKKPLFIKMPIEKTNEEFLSMLQVISKYPVAGIIVGNLQKDRTVTSLDREEVKRWPVGNFSGLPTQQRSEELIALTYKKYGKKLTIIGCGGIFSAADAYRKIKMGASIVQLITGIIFEGPQLIAEINTGLEKLLTKDGFNKLSEAVGSGNK